MQGGANPTFLDEVPVREAIPLAKPVEDPLDNTESKEKPAELHGTEPLRENASTDSGLAREMREEPSSSEQLLEQRERASTPYPRPDFSTPAEKVVPIPIVPAPKDFSGFEPESPGDWNLPEPRRTFPLPPTNVAPAHPGYREGEWNPDGSAWGAPPTSGIGDESRMPWQNPTWNGTQFGSLLGRPRSARFDAPALNAYRDQVYVETATMGAVHGENTLQAYSAPSDVSHPDMHAALRHRLKDQYWQLHLGKSLPTSQSSVPIGDPNTCQVPYQPLDFQPIPFQPRPSNPQQELETYYGKLAIETQRPWVEWWRPFYTGGMYEPGVPVFSDVNLLTPSFLVYGDYRTGVGVHRNNGDPVRSWAHRLNLDMDLRLTGTERFHMFTGPLDHNGRFTRLDFSDGSARFEDELDFQLDTAFFEGDAGAITGSWLGTDAPFDLPFTCGLVPLLYQNGIWMEDAVAGFAVGSPWRHNRTLNWANFDATFFAGFNQVTSPAFANDNNAAAVYGTAWFVEAYDGYIEMDYAYLDDLDGLGRSYHNAAVAYTRRYFGRISNSIRLLGNAGQSGAASSRTADGALLLFENSLITAMPSTVVPYCNLFVGNGRPQSVARAGNAGGILRNTGINFETDGLTGYPTLNATASNAYGGALGINILSADFRQQWILEFASQDTYGDPALSDAAGPEYALGTRYQRALNNRFIWRIDFMNGWLDDGPDIFGTRTEFRWKF
jgi:hypothetical protein